MTFTGFPQTALDLLAEAAGQDLSWYRSHRLDLRDTLVAPARELVVDLGTHLRAAVSPTLVVDPRINGTLAPLINDARFARTAPVKGYLDLRFAEAGVARADSPVILLRVTPTEVRLGAGARFPGDVLDRYRGRVAGPAGHELQDIVDLLVRRRSADVRPTELRRVPAGYPADHPRADLLRRRSLQVSWSEPLPRAIGSARFVPWSARRLAGFADLHRWLRDLVADGQDPMRTASDNVTELSSAK